MAKIPNSASNIATSPIEKRQKRSHSDINAAEASYIHQPDNKINSPRIKSTRDPPKLQGDPTLKDPKGPNNHDTKSHRDQEDPAPKLIWNYNPLVAPKPARRQQPTGPKNNKKRPPQGRNAPWRNSRRRKSSHATRRE
ncbi:hypothetical protein ACFX2I_003375 [Malus domestica]